MVKFKLLLPIQMFYLDIAQFPIKILRAFSLTSLIVITRIFLDIINQRSIKIQSPVLIYLWPILKISVTSLIWC